MTRPVAVGLAIAAAGLLLFLVGLLVAAGAFGWFGRLPGDIRVERPGFRLYLPIASMLLVSIVLSLALTLVRRLLR